MLSESEMRCHRCCFTGHRPEKLQRSETDIRIDLEYEILKSIHDGFDVFISGMARGIDIEAAEIVIRLKNKGYPLKLICAIPFPGFEKNWNKDWQYRYTTVICKSDLVRYIRPKYSKDCFQIRNEWLVNHSFRVIAVFNGQPSGTKNTIEYARQKGVPVVQIRG